MIQMYTVGRKADQYLNLNNNNNKQTNMAFKMRGYSAGEGTGSTMAKKALVGAQNNLPEGLKAKIEAAPGKMYDKTMAKQKEVGGTKNKKGNIFTKRGRTQRSINKVEKTKDKLRDNANKEGFDTKKSKKLMKKVTKKTVKRDNKIHKYLSKEDRKNNPDQYKGVKFAGDDGMDKN